jgi:hypothetical protein
MQAEKGVSNENVQIQRVAARMGQARQHPDRADGLISVLFD